VRGRWLVQGPFGGAGVQGTAHRGLVRPGAGPRAAPRPPPPANTRASLSRPRAPRSPLPPPLPPAEFGASLHPVTAASVYGAYLGESERRLRGAFESAATAAASGGGALAVVFLDEVDALAPRRGAGGPHEARVAAQLLTLLDAAGDGPAGAPGGARGGAAGGGVEGGAARRGRVVVVAATNRPNAVDPALRRPGRLDREVAVPVPDAAARAAILTCAPRGGEGGRVEEAARGSGGSNRRPPAPAASLHCSIAARPQAAHRGARARARRRPARHRRGLPRLLRR
jgi:SpoVK/Ycf46/Vps4 family AAA+-type ATPase